MKLYEEINAIEDAINSILFSELDDEEQQEALDNLMKAKTETIANGLEALCKIRARKQADIIALKTEAERLNTRAKQEERSLASLQEYMLSLLNRSGQPKVSAGTFNVGSRTSTVVFLDETFNDERYMRTTTKTEPDKVAIKEALQSGEHIEGANLYSVKHISIK